MKQPTLTLCMIVKDNEQTIDRALRNVGAYVDELVVVDTGSQDGTIDVARKYGATIYPFGWVDNFSLAKNAYMDKVRTDWILDLEADERIPEESFEEIRAIIGTGRADIYDLLRYELFVDYRWYEKADEIMISKDMLRGQTLAHRVFKNLPGVLRWHGVVHAMLLFSTPLRQEHTRIGFYHLKDASVLSKKRKYYWRMLLRSFGDGHPREQCECLLRLAKLRKFHLVKQYAKQIKFVTPDSVTGFRTLGDTLSSLGRQEEAEEIWRVTGRNGGKGELQ